MKKTIKAVIALMLILAMAVTVLTGCGSEKENGGSEAENQNPEVIQDEEPEDVPEEEPEKPTSTLHATDLIKEIDPNTATVEDVNALVGFEGEINPESSSGSCTWVLSNSETLRLVPGLYVQAEFNKEYLANPDVDFSKIEELKTVMQNGISYDEFISYIGGVEGTPIQIGLNGPTNYVWVGGDARSYLTCSFSEYGDHSAQVMGGMIY